MDYVISMIRLNASHMPNDEGTELSFRARENIFAELHHLGYLIPADVADAARTEAAIVDAANDASQSRRLRQH